MTLSCPNFLCATVTGGDMLPKWHAYALLTRLLKYLSELWNQQLTQLICGLIIVALECWHLKMHMMFVGKFHS